MFLPFSNLLWNLLFFLPVTAPYIKFCHHAFNSLLSLCTLLYWLFKFTKSLMYANYFFEFHIRWNILCVQFLNLFLRLFAKHFSWCNTVPLWWLILGTKQSLWSTEASEGEWFKHLLLYSISYIIDTTIKVSAFHILPATLWFLLASSTILAQQSCTII